MARSSRLAPAPEQFNVTLAKSNGMAQGTRALLPEGVHPPCQLRRGSVCQAVPNQRVSDGLAALRRSRAGCARLSPTD